MKNKVCLIIVVTCFFLVSVGQSAEIIVHPGDDTLTAAILTASDGDTLILEDGGYSGNVTVNKSLTIRAANRATNSVIKDMMDIRGDGIEVTVQGLKFSKSIFLTDAAAINLLENEWLSGGINCNYYSTSGGDGSLVIVGNRIDEPPGSISDIRIDGAYIAGNTILNGSIRSESYVWIVGNEVINYAEAINSRNGIGSGGNAFIIANRVRCNNSSAVPSCIHSDASSAYIANNIVEVNDLSGSTWTQHGIYATTGHATIVNNIVRGMPALPSRTGSGIYVTAPNARISGNIIIDYLSNSNEPIAWTSPSAEVSHNLCFNNSGNCPPSADGNLDLDPMFVDTEDYQLAVGSPAINAGPPDYKMADLDLSRNDIGVYGGPWSIDQYDHQREPDNLAPFVYPLNRTETFFKGGLLEVRVLGIARLR